jgi:nucleoside-diphosphate-sugar epimerase
VNRLRIKNLADMTGRLLEHPNFRAGVFIAVAGLAIKELAGIVAELSDSSAHLTRSIANDRQIRTRIRDDIGILMTQRDQLRTELGLHPDPELALEPEPAAPPAPAARTGEQLLEPADL